MCMSLWFFVPSRFSTIDCTMLCQLCCNLRCDTFLYAHGNDLLKLYTCFCIYIVCLCLQACFFAQHDLIDVTFSIYTPGQKGFSHEQHISKDESFSRPVQWLVVAFIYRRFTCHACNIVCKNDHRSVLRDQWLMDFILRGTCWVDDFHPFPSGWDMYPFPGV